MKQMWDAQGRSAALQEETQGGEEGVGRGGFFILHAVLQDFPMAKVLGK